MHGWFNQAICLPQTHSDPPQGPGLLNQPAWGKGGWKGPSKRRQMIPKSIKKQTEFLSHEGLIPFPSISPCLKALKSWENRGEKPASSSLSVSVSVTTFYWGACGSWELITSCVSQKGGPCLSDQGVKCFHVNVKLASRLLDDTCIFEKSTVSVTLFPPYTTLYTSFGAGHLNAESSIMRARGKPSKRYLPSQHTSIIDSGWWFSPTWNMVI